MKRVLAVFLAITLIGSLTACGTGKKDETKAGQETKATQEVKAESKEEISTAEAEAAASDGQAEGMVPDYLEFLQWFPRRKLVSGGFPAGSTCTGGNRCHIQGCCRRWIC